MRCNIRHLTLLANLLHEEEKIAGNARDRGEKQGRVCVIPTTSPAFDLRLRLPPSTSTLPSSFPNAAFSCGRHEVGDFSCPSATAASVGRNGVAIYCEDRWLFRGDR